VILRRLACACLGGLLAACGGERLVLGGDGDAGCTPGAYLGTYTCNMAPDSSFQTMGAGSISLRLTGDRGGPTLFIAPGAKIAGSQGVTSTADLSGALDCATNKLQGTLSNVSFGSGPLNAVLTGTGTLSADYDATASPAVFVDGILSWQQGALAGFQGQTCAWSATLQ
jgi:hypothetical protein